MGGLGADAQGLTDFLPGRALVLKANDVSQKGLSPPGGACHHEVADDFINGLPEAGSHPDLFEQAISPSFLDEADYRSPREPQQESAGAGI